jgi:pyridoxine/pyridoxamine 5'-phosphate oxidase
MPVLGSSRRFSSRRIEAVARALLDASPLCAIATVSPPGRAHVNTVYFAWSEAVEIVWISAPEARHSRNLAGNPSAAVSVFDSKQTWGKPDRGIQLFGTAGEATADAAERVYRARFAEYAPEDFPGYRLYRLKTRRLKVFDERELGSASS